MLHFVCTLCTHVASRLVGVYVCGGMRVPTWGGSKQANASEFWWFLVGENVVKSGVCVRIFGANCANLCENGGFWGPPILGDFGGGGGYPIFGGFLAFFGVLRVLQLGFF